MGAQWLLWLAVALVAGVVEILSLGLVFAMIAGGALAAAAVAALTDSVVLAVLAFATGTGALLVGVRPALMRYAARADTGAPTGIAALIGQPARVIRPVDAQGGQVKLSGEFWSARSDVHDAVLELGSTVEVVRIEGATAVVRAATSPAARSPGLPGGEPRALPDVGRPPGGDAPTDGSEV